ncbi:MAG: hypothetical protein ACRD59_08175 [Candidatus Acidiferrales bacterium]
MQKAQTQNASAARKVLDFPQHDDENAIFENDVKARLQELTEFVEGFTGSTVNLLLVEKASAREILEELVVKEAALRWIVRVATLSSEPVRERLWADIDRAVTDLEKTARLLKRARVTWPERDSIPVRDEVVRLTYI